MNKAKIGGILEIISGIFGLIYIIAWLVIGYLRGFLTFGEDGYLPPEFFSIVIVFVILFFISSSLALIGGLFAFKKQRWSLALIGAIFSMMMFFLTGIPGLIFIIMAKPEFTEKPIVT